jgi:hypothetical protein
VEYRRGISFIGQREVDRALRHVSRDTQMQLHCIAPFGRHDDAGQCVRAGRPERQVMRPAGCSW